MNTHSLLVRLVKRYGFITYHNSVDMLESMSRNPEFLLSRLLRSIRRESGKTLLDLSEALGVTVSDASRIESRDISKLTERTIEQWLQICDMPELLSECVEIFRLTQPSSPTVTES